MIVSPARLGAQLGGLELLPVLAGFILQGLAQACSCDCRMVPSSKREEVLCLSILKAFFVSSVFIGLLLRSKPRGQVQTLRVEKWFSLSGGRGGRASPQRVCCKVMGVTGDSH